MAEGHEPGRKARSADRQPVYGTVSLPIACLCRRRRPRWSSARPEAMVVQHQVTFNAAIFRACRSAIKGPG